nr:uncharacterized protein CI109_002696 [Kwoniella shandongensis]KAA5528939.1 hypothetical protein CI109_002696 [Kwoniella shandongensis]
MDQTNRSLPRVSTTNLASGLASGGYSAPAGTPSWRSGPSPSPTPPITGATPTTPLPPPTTVAPRALTEREGQLVKHLSRLQFFLATAPTRWMGTEEGSIKAQKVFYWFSVPHDRLFLDALERDLKREKMGLEPTTVVVGEPARSFRYDPKRSLFEQFAGKQPGLEESVNTQTILPEAALSQNVTSSGHLGLPNHPFATSSMGQKASKPPVSHINDGAYFDATLPASPSQPAQSDQESEPLTTETTAHNVLFSRSLLKGSPAYKQGRRKLSRDKRQRQRRDGTTTTDYDTGEDDSGSESGRLDQSKYLLTHPQAESSLSNLPFAHPPPPLFNSNRPSDADFASHDLTRPMVQTRPLSTIVATGVVQHQYESTRQPQAPWTSATHPMQSDQPGSQSTSTTFNPSPESNGLSGGTPTTGPALKGFSCPLLSCGRLFKRLEHLKRHVRTHTQERPYECTRCSKRFSRSDNLTQHLKTHEKVDRGERMKTEASESTEDDMATLLEAQVDAMAARENRGYPSGTGGLLRADGAYPSYAEINQSGQYNAARLPFPPTSFDGSDSYATLNLPSESHLHRPQATPISTNWPNLGGLYDQSIPTGAHHTNGFLAKRQRHRSMTPSLGGSHRAPVAGQTGLRSSPYLGPARYHPYSVAALSSGTQTFPRAASLDPSAFQTRGGLYNGSVSGQDTEMTSTIRGVTVEPTSYGAPASTNQADAFRGSSFMQALDAIPFVNSTMDEAPATNEGPNHHQSDSSQHIRK